MKPEDFAERLRTREVPWDAAAAQRTLARVEARLNAPTRTGRPHVVFAFAAAAAVLLLALSVRHFLGRHAAAPTAAVETRAAVTLPDTSIALLARDAHIDVPEHSETALSILQDRGSVEYRVTPGLKRVFTVRARNLEIRVVGTAFTVALEPGSTVISVDHGRVMVSDGKEMVALTAHERREYPILASPPQLPVASAATSTAAASAGSESLAPTAPEPLASSHFAAGSPGSSERAGQPLLLEADRARRAGKLPEAINALQQFLQANPSDGRVASAAFTLGRLYRQTGNLSAAAQAFRVSYQKDASGALAEDARAQEIEALTAASAWDPARAAAKKYLELYPRGRYRSRITPLLE